MKTMIKLRLLLTAVTLTIALLASAFISTPKKTAEVTSYFANESH
jgi:hypothetical protein